MIETDEDALICDLAETYHIYNYRSLPALLVATFSVGLRDDSRIKMKMNDMEHSFDRMLLAGILDKLAMLVWMQSQDGTNGVNKPISVLQKLLGEETSEDKDIISFDSPDSFEFERQRIIERSKQ